MENSVYIVTFHSSSDCIVRQYFKRLQDEGIHIFVRNTKQGNTRQNEHTDSFRDFTESFEGGRTMTYY